MGKNATAPKPSFKSRYFCLRDDKFFSILKQDLQADDPVLFHCYQFASILVTPIVASARDGSNQFHGWRFLAVITDLCQSHVQIHVHTVDTFQRKQAVANARDTVWTTHSPHDQCGLIRFLKVVQEPGFCKWV